jgi:hypothetical protein
MADDDRQHDDDQHDDDRQDDRGDDRQDDDRDDELELIRTDPEGAKRTIEQLRRENVEHRRKLRKAEQDLERAKTEGLSEKERELAEAEQRGRAAAAAEHGRRLLEAQVLAAAAGKLQDPDDAVRYLDLEGLLELDEDDRELDKRIDRLVDEKPYLGVSDNGAGRKVGVQSQGARTKPGGTKDTDVDGSAWLRKAARRGRS